jgi:hypothetical protein
MMHAVNSTLHRQPTWQWFVALLCLVLLNGCGRGLASVDGTVTLDGAKLAGGSDVRGTVFFYPDGQSGAPGIGILDANGHYELMTGSQAGVAPGQYSVAISATRIIMPKDRTGMPGGKPMTPRKYADPKQSGFHADVQPGSNTFDFALSSKPGQ